MYEPSRRPNGRTRRGSRRLRTEVDSSSNNSDRVVSFAASSVRIQMTTRSVPNTGGVSNRRTVMSVVYGGILVAAALGAVLTSRAEDWAPLSLVGLLFVLAAGSELLNVEIRDLRLSGSFVAFVLAMALLGPAPAAALMAALRRCSTAPSRANSLDRKLVNVATFADGRARRAASRCRRSSATSTRATATRCGSPASCSASSWRANTLNFLMIAAPRRTSGSACPSRVLGAVVRHRAAVAVRDRAADRRRRVHLRASRHRARSAWPP